jgi:predicted nucleic acid-binding protein
VTRRWIVDAWPLIALAKIDLADLLLDLADEILVPAEVAEEIVAGPAGDPARRLLESGFGRRVRPRSVPSEIVEWGLGRGETSVLALVLETANATALLDDAAARRCAAVLRVPLLGTLGVVLLAKRSGRIDNAGNVLRQLRDAGSWIDDDLVRTALASVGESPTND